MTVVVVTPPTVPLVSLDDAKRHLRVDDDDNDDFIVGLVETARSWIDAPDGWLGRALMKQTLEWRIDSFWHRRRDQHALGNDDIAIPFPPTIEIASIKYDDGDGVEQTLDPSLYRLVGGGSARSRLVPAYGKSWPATRGQEEAVRIQFDAGYGEETDDVPAAIRHAIMLLIGHLYENRETEVVGARAAAVELPTGASALLSPFMVF